MPNVVDFFVLKEHYEEARARNWKPGKVSHPFCYLFPTFFQFCSFSLSQIFHDGAYPSSCVNYSSRFLLT